MTDPMKSPTSSDALNPVERAVVDHTFALQPQFAVFLGLHEYDGKVPDLSRAATDRWCQAADQLLAQLRAIPKKELSQAREMDRRLLELTLQSPLFDLRESRDFERNPMSYVGYLPLTSYMVRDYAPIEQRSRAMVETLEAAPRVLRQGFERLDSTLPKPFVQLALSMASGLAVHYQEAEDYVAKRSASAAKLVARARAEATPAVSGFVERLKGEYLPRAKEDFALGKELYRRLLLVREGITTPAEEILRAGKEDLQRNQRRLKEIAETKKLEVAKLFEELFQRHPSAADLVPSARRLVEETRAFVAQKGLVTIPEPSECRVEETPQYSRALYTASMNAPGPFESKSAEGIYFITPVDPEWPPERQEEWLRSFNFALLKNVTVHEVYPGHYLQLLHHRRAEGSLTRKVFFSAAFVEGWAHYAEQLAIEQGLGDGALDAEAAQIHDALLRDCRLIASIGLHTQGMTVAEATELFQREAHFETLPAEREAIRGTFNPEYFCYTLGKLAILDARKKHLARTFGGSLKQFHDRLLGFGCPPVGMLDPLLTAS